MELKDRILVINENNMAGLLHLYGKMNNDELEQIVNRHLGACLDNIETYLAMVNQIPHCNECGFLKCYDHTYKNYYCDHESRTDEIGKVGINNPPKTSPIWCPKRGREDNGR